MKITGYRELSWLYHRGHPSGDANSVSPDDVSRATYLFLETDAGVTGIVPASSPDVAKLFPVLEGKDPRGVIGLWKEMSDVGFKGGVEGSMYGAMCALDSAMWDIKAKDAGQPLWKFLGASEPRVKAYASGLDMGMTDDELVEFYTEYADRGVDGGKLKVGLDFESDMRRLEIMREVLKKNAKEPLLMIDSNEYWSAKQAIRYISRIEEKFDLTWAEEPGRRWDYRGLRQISRGIKTAVATGENINGIDEFYPLIHNEAVDVVQFGTLGVTSFLQIAHFAEAYELPISIIGSPGSCMAHAAAAAPNHLAQEVKDLTPPTGVSIDNDIVDGFIEMGDAPGLGFTVDEDAIAEMNANPLKTKGSGMPGSRRKGAGLYIIPPEPGETGLY
ncbi:MAG: mandelate racemase/muconate lactonizing enzyme family protein [Dehalococcoidia bacterium]|jgi:L-alanine-DL-glutamate epimerase-like enolase superfamily enzyme